MCICARKWKCDRHVPNALIFNDAYLMNEFVILEEAVHASEQVMLAEDENNHRDKRQAGVGPPDPYGFRFISLFVLIYLQIF